MKIYLAMAQFDHSSNNIIKAFYEKDKANLFIQKCKEYNETKIDCPLDANDKIFDIWYEKNNIWLENCPAGIDYANADKYYIYDIEVE